MKWIVALCGSLLLADAQPSFPALQSVVQPGKKITNSFTLLWDHPPGYEIMSNRVTRTNPYLTNIWWVADVTQSVFSLVRTSGEPRWQITVAAMSVMPVMSAESQPVVWPAYPPANRVYQFFAWLSPSNRVIFFAATNPSGNEFVRLWSQPTNATFPTPLWFPQRSSNLQQWTGFGSPIVAPQTPRLKLGVTNYSF